MDQEKTYSVCEKNRTVLTRLPNQRKQEYNTNLIEGVLNGAAGVPVRECRSKREAEIARTNWTQLADEWMRAKERVEDQFGVALLPSDERVRELPPTAATEPEITSAEELKRVCHSDSRSVFNRWIVCIEKNYHIQVENTVQALLYIFYRLRIVLSSR